MSAFLTESAKQHEEIAVAMESVAKSIESLKTILVDSSDIAAEYRVLAGINRAVAEYYRENPYTQGAYSGTPDKEISYAYQLFSSHFLTWLAEKAKEEERKEAWIERKKKFQELRNEE